jgi:hypothetical protein
LFIVALSAVLLPLKVTSPALSIVALPALLLFLNRTVQVFVMVALLAKLLLLKWTNPSLLMIALPAVLLLLNVIPLHPQRNKKVCAFEELLTMPDCAQFERVG